MPSSSKSKNIEKTLVSEHKTCGTSLARFRIVRQESLVKFNEMSDKEQKSQTELIVFHKYYIDIDCYPHTVDGWFSHTFPHGCRRSLFLNDHYFLSYVHLCKCTGKRKLKLLLQKLLLVIGLIHLQFFPCCVYSSIEFPHGIEFHFSFHVKFIL